MTALATTTDVENRLGRTLTATETTRANALLEDASAVVIGYCRDDFVVVEPETVPAAVVGVVAKMVARAIERAATSQSQIGVQSVQTGPFATNFTAVASADEIWLSGADKLALRAHRNAVTSIATYGERYTETTDS